VVICTCAHVHAYTGTVQPRLNLPARVALASAPPQRIPLTHDHGARPTSLRRLSLLRVLDSTFLGRYLWMRARHSTERSYRARAAQSDVSGERPAASPWGRCGWGLPPSGIERNDAERGQPLERSPLGQFAASFRFGSGTRASDAWPGAQRLTLGGKLRDCPDVRRRAAARQLGSSGWPEAILSGIQPRLTEEGTGATCLLRGGGGEARDLEMALHLGARRPRQRHSSCNP